MRTCNMHNMQMNTIVRAGLVRR